MAQRQSGGIIHPHYLAAQRRYNLARSPPLIAVDVVGSRTGARVHTAVRLGGQAGGRSNGREWDGAGKEGCWCVRGEGRSSAAAAVVVAVAAVVVEEEAGSPPHNNRFGFYSFFFFFFLAHAAGVHELPPESSSV